ncbi:hypothetical protein H098_28315 [Pseudomonas fluorescens FH5]|nr:hypothetical protein H098_28315 [Pseudomonas fluorescens FH5]
MHELSIFGRAFVARVTKIEDIARSEKTEEGPDLFVGASCC